MESLMRQGWRVLQTLGSISKSSLLHFRNDHCNEIAATLTYVTLLSMVPMATIVFDVVQEIPFIHDGLVRLEALLISIFAPDLGKDVSLYLHQFVNRTQALTWWSVPVLLVTIFWAFATVERTFNRIWNVPQPRRTWLRLVTYFMLILLGPLLLVIGVSATIFFSGHLSSDLLASAVLSIDWLYLGFVFATGWLIFMLMYRWIPNRHIAWRYAAAGGLVAAILFELSKRIFTMYLAWFPTHEVIYGAVALLPLLMVWLHLVWAIILLGAEVCFSFEEYCQQQPTGTEKAIFCNKNM